MNTYYLNNSGSRWVTFDEAGKRQRIQLTTRSGKVVERRVTFWESFGNHTLANISWKGKRLRVFADSLLDD